MYLGSKRILESCLTHSKTQDSHNGSDNKKSENTEKGGNKGKSDEINSNSKERYITILIVSC